MAQRVLFAKHDSALTFNATLYGTDENGPVVAEVTYKQISEEGEIALRDPLAKFVISHKTGSGRWAATLASDSSETVEPVIEAHKPKWHSSTLSIQMENVSFEMVKPKLLKRDYEIYRLNSGAEQSNEKTKVGEITRNPGLRHKYSISFDSDMRLELVVFCYWMVNLYSKRDTVAANSHGGNTGAY